MRYDETGLAAEAVAEPADARVTARVRRHVPVRGRQCRRERYDRPFEVIGAPWLDHDRAVGLLNGLGLRGVVFEPVTFTPEQKPYHGRPPGLSASA